VSEALGVSLVTSIVADKGPATSGANATSNEHESLWLRTFPHELLLTGNAPGSPADSFDNVIVIGVALVFVTWTVWVPLV
jgi:hypothetical protein